MSEGPKVRCAPNSKESEMMVLGCMLTSVNSLNIGSDSLDDSDFYYTEHKSVFSALKHLYKNDKPADIHLVAETLKAREKLQSIGGIGFLTTLAQYSGTSAYIEHYADIVRNKSLLRRMISSAQIVEKKALDEPDDVGAALDEAQSLFYKISQAANTQDGKLVSEVLTGVKSEAQQHFIQIVEERQQKYQEEGEQSSGITGVPTGLLDLDKVINGLDRSNLIIVGGRPGMGKTAISLNIAEHVAFHQKIPVGIFSLEMSAEQLVHRLVCSRSQVESDKIRTGALDGSEFQRIVGAVNGMMDDAMVIDDQPGLKITDLRARARRMKEAHNIGLLVIDYLQLIAGSGVGRQGDNRQMEVSEISRMLKTLARELDIPVICGSQLSRRVEERQGHRPMLADLRESGSIEQDADQILFLLRRDYYDENDKPGMAEVIVAKNRHGAVGNVNLTYRKEFGLFTNYTPVEYMVDPQMAAQAEDSFGDFQPTN